MARMVVLDSGVTRPRVVGGWIVNIEYYAKRSATSPVRQAAMERGLPELWLNDDVKLHISTREAKNELTLPGVAGA